LRDAPVDEPRNADAREREHELEPAARQRKRHLQAAEVDGRDHRVRNGIGVTAAIFAK
jgi:hypothetical protein